MTDSKESIRVGAPPAPGDAPPVLVVKPKRMRWEVPITVAAVGVLLVLGATLVGLFKASDAKLPQAVASASPSPSLAEGDLGSKTACSLNKLADEQDQLLNPDAIGAILGASKESVNDSIRTRAALLSEQQKLAIAAHGADDEARRVIDLHTASLELQTACIQAGY